MDARSPIFLAVIALAAAGCGSTEVHGGTQAAVAATSEIASGLTSAPPDEDAPVADASAAKAPPSGCASELVREPASVPRDPSDLLFYVNRWNAVPAAYPVSATSLWTPCAGGNPGVEHDLVCLPRGYVYAGPYAGHEALRSVAFESDAPTDRTTTHDGLPVGFQGKIGFKAMMDAARAEASFTLLVRSGFRPFKTQEATFLGWVAQEVAQGRPKDEAWLRVQSYSAKAGHSEHQLGTTADLVYKNENGIIYDGWDPHTIAASAPMTWLAANAHRFGLVLTYDEGRENVTQYVWEPWHYRFVGVEAADDMRRCGLSTEEFLQLRYRIGPPPAFSPHRGRLSRR